MTSLYGYVRVRDAVIDYSAVLEPCPDSGRMKCVQVIARRLPLGPNVSLKACELAQLAVSDPDMVEVERQIERLVLSGDI